MLKRPTGAEKAARGRDRGACGLRRLIEKAAKGRVWGQRRLTEMAAKGRVWGQRRLTEMAARERDCGA